MFAGNFAPVGWAFCDGQLTPISENETLFNLIGTTYGGDGQETFAMPDLRGRVPIHMGGAQSGTNYLIGESAGVEQVTLTTNQIPNHNHAMLASADSADQITGQNGVPAAPPQLPMYFASSPDTSLNTASVTPVGGNQPHDNMQPYLCVNFIISLFGVFPSP